MKLVFATHNQNKLREVKALIPSHIQLLSLTDIDCHEDIPETSETMEGNAFLKSSYVHANYGYNCFADDTGLEVEALDNAPGVYSARYAGPENNSEANMAKLLNELKDTTNRKAQFKTVISLILNDQETKFTGLCEGVITKEQKGEKGFGYDPLFQPKGFQKTFAQMTLEEKGRIGHRGKAMKQLVSFLNQ